MDRDGALPVQVVDFAGLATVVSLTVVCILTVIALSISPQSVRRMFFFGSVARTLRLANLVASIVFLASLFSLVNTAMRDTLPSFTAMLLLWLSLIYLFGFFGISFLVDEFGVLASQMDPHSKPSSFKRKRSRRRLAKRRIITFDERWEGMLDPVLEFLDVQDLFVIHPVSKRWEMSARTALLRCRKLTAVPGAAVLDLSRYGCCSSLAGANLMVNRSLRHESVMFGDKLLGNLTRRCSPANGGSLVELNLDFVNSVTNSGLQQAIQNIGFTEIESLTMNWSQGMTTTAMSFLSTPLRKLRVFSIDGCRFSDASLVDVFSSQRSLEVVSLRETNAGAVCVQSLIAKNPNLHSLDLSTVEIDDRDLRQIARVCSNLTSLHLDQCPLITDDAVAEVLYACEQLRRMSLRNKQLTDKSLIFGLDRQRPLLESLDLSTMSISESGFEHVVRNLPNLISLSVGSCRNLSDVSLKAVGDSCHALEHLEVLETSVTFEGLQYVAQKCAKIKTVNASHLSSLHDEDVIALAREFTQIRLLSISGCPNVSRAALEEVSHQHPSLRIFYEYVPFSSSRHQETKFQRVKMSLFRLGVAQGIGLALVLQSVGLLFSISSRNY